MKNSVENIADSQHSFSNISVKSESFQKTLPELDVTDDTACDSFFDIGSDIIPPLSKSSPRFVPISHGDQQPHSPVASQGPFYPVRQLSSGQAAVLELETLNWDNAILEHLAQAIEAILRDNCPGVCSFSDFSCILECPYPCYPDDVTSVVHRKFGQALRSAPHRDQRAFAAALYGRWLMECSSSTSGVINSPEIALLTSVTARCLSETLLDLQPQVELLVRALQSSGGSLAELVGVYWLLLQAPHRGITVFASVTQLLATTATTSLCTTGNQGMLSNVTARAFLSAMRGISGADSRTFPDEVFACIPSFIVLSPGLADEIQGEIEATIPLILARVVCDSQRRLILGTTLKLYQDLTDSIIRQRSTSSPLADFGLVHSLCLNHISSALMLTRRFGLSITDAVDGRGQALSPWISAAVRLVDVLLWCFVSFPAELIRHRELPLTVAVPVSSALPTLSVDVQRRLAPIVPGLQSAAAGARRLGCNGEASVITHAAREITRAGRPAILRAPGQALDRLFSKEDMDIVSGPPAQQQIRRTERPRLTTISSEAMSPHSPLRMEAFSPKAQLSL